MSCAFEQLGQLLYDRKAMLGFIESLKEPRFGPDFARAPIGLAAVVLFSENPFRLSHPPQHFRTESHADPLFGFHRDPRQLFRR
jgi:hypothetical protein